MSNTVLVASFGNINAASNNRILSIYKHLSGGKEVITTDFDHAKKHYYEPETLAHPNQVVLHVPSYNKNLSVKRIWSHIVFAFRVGNYLKSLSDKPSAVYCTMPTSSSAYVCARYCKKHGVKFVIDVIDLWPDSLLPLVKGKPIIKKILFPWTYLTRYSYKAADVILGESVKYAFEAKKFNERAQVYPIYLGVDVSFIKTIKDNRVLRIAKPHDEIWIGYAGSLGNSYDFYSLLNAVKSIHGKYKYKLWFIGEGDKREEIDFFIKDNGLNAEITGYLPYDQLLEYLLYIDIAINIFRENTKVVYSYKFNDYVAMGCFILNSLKGETASLVDDYKIGRNFDFKDHSLKDVLADTLSKWEYYSRWKVNSQKLIEEKLDKDKIYSRINQLINT